MKTNQNPASKVVALMSMSIDGCVTDVNDGVDEVFDSGTMRLPGEKGELPLSGRQRKFY